MSDINEIITLRQENKELREAVLALRAVCDEVRNINKWKQSYGLMDTKIHGILREGLRVTTKFK